MDYHWQYGDQDIDIEDDFDHSLDNLDHVHDADGPLQAGKYGLGLHKYYVPSWTGKDAFRELYQNWKDAIVGSFHLDPRSFTPIVREAKQQIQITVHAVSTSPDANDPGDLLGYILFDKNKGTLEITNFKAALQQKHLSLGASDKTENDELAGIHGEGFKLAALVLYRRGHSMRLTSTSFYWNFRLLGKYQPTLFCRLSAIKTEPLQKRKERFAAQSSVPTFKRGLTANAWEDVTVLISKPRGTNNPGINEAQFRSWLKVALELTPHDPTDIVRTPEGDLILDASFKERIYLKGLRIAGHEKMYVYGYNFATGEINRDRDRLSDLEAEKTKLSMIWGDSILKIGDSMADRYIEILQNHKDSAEAKHTVENLSQRAVKRVWRRLRQRNPDSFFYFSNENYSASSDADQTVIIRDDFKQQPYNLSEKSWKLFKKFDLIRTPKEEQVHRFQSSRPVTIMFDSFQSNVIRTLKACLALDRNLKPLKVCFVDGGGTSLDLMFDTVTNEIRINQKWLDFDHVHKQSVCDAMCLSSADIDRSAIFCDHVVEDLLDEVLEEFRTTSDINLIDHKAYRGRARACLRKMPCSIQANLTSAAGTIEVSWIGNENGFITAKHSDHVKYYVVLHRESTCKNFRKELIFRGGATPTDYHSHTSAMNDVAISNRCGCASQVVSRTRSKALFENLDHHEIYFPMVARAEETSFFGTPPMPVSPKPPISNNVQLTPPPDTTIPTITPRRRQRSSRKAKGWSRKKRTPTTVKSEPPSDDEDLGAIEFLPTVYDESSPAEEAGTPTIHVSEIEVAKEDEAYWYNWSENELPLELGKFNAGFEQNLSPQNVCSFPGVDVEPLNFRFERGGYARVRVGETQFSDILIFVHDIFSEETERSLETMYLLVTKYSLLRSTMPFHRLPTVSDRTGVNISQEVLLHFHSFDMMGLRGDAEIIKLNEITRAGPLTSRTGDDGKKIRHLNVSARDLDASALFCRFAIRRSKHDTEYCLTPVNSHLLERADWWTNVEYPTVVKPVVYDFSPEILGPSEGFSQARFDIEHAFGFDPKRDLSWKVRHSTSQVYDGTPKNILESISKGQLCPPTSTKDNVPRVAVIAGCSVPFRFNDANQSLPSLDQFTKILGNVIAVAQSELEPTFVVLLTSPAMLHSRASGSFVETLFDLLECRFSVHMKLCSLQQLGLPSQKEVLVTIVSRFCAPVPWTMFWPNSPGNSSVPIRSLIGDLMFKSSRVLDNSKPALVCSDLSHEVLEEGRLMRKLMHIYNHGTGQFNTKAIPVQWETEKLEVLTSSPKTWVHPSRQDLLTVRELARLQGFPDDFIFYEPYDMQYKLVWTAIPPAVTKIIGNMIHYMLQSHQVVKVGILTRDTRGQKRIRLDDEE